MLEGDRQLRTTIPTVVALVGVFVVAVSLALPWLAIGSAPARSSIDLIGSLNALDFLGGAALGLLLGTWLVVPIAAAAALVLGALGRTKAAVAIVLVVCLLIGAAAFAVVVIDAVGLAWGGWVGCGAAMIGGGAAIVALVAGARHHRPRSVL